MSLYGQYAWVIGGAGTVGTGLCRGLLRAGATVLVNSRHPNRLTALADDLGHPEQLTDVAHAEFVARNPHAYAIVRL